MYVTNITIIKPHELGEDIIIPVIKVEMIPLLVGGGDGSKFYLQIADQVVSRYSHFIAKEYLVDPELMIPELRAIASMYQRLCLQNYPVPESVCYFTFEGKAYLIMSDMTNSGIYDLWGYNDDATVQERQTLANMNLSSQDIQTIKKIAYELAEKATRDGYVIMWSFYHIRKHKQTGIIDMVLLDIAPNLTTKSPFLKKENYAQVKIFLKESINEKNILQKKDT